MKARELSRVMRQIATVPSRIATAVARDITQEIQDNFDRGVDPFYRSWRPLADSTLARGRHPPPLTDTGAGRAGVAVVPRAGAGLRMVVSVGYMEIHQTGSLTIPNRPPRRSFLPVSKMPDTWLEIYQHHMDQEITRTLGGRRV
jgi:phage gpG-like protein